MNELAVAVIGAGAMGADHLIRLGRRTRGARVVAVVEPDETRSARALTLAPGAAARATLAEALEMDRPQAVLIATPGQFHEQAVVSALNAGSYVFCEKPMTMDSDAALRIMQAEQRLGRVQLQVGFMRRFDDEYQRLRALVADRALGELLALHCFHRAPTVPDTWTREMLITDAAAHEVDIVPWLAGSDLVSIEVLDTRPSRHSAIGDPVILALRLASGVTAVVEINVHARFGYQVRTEAVFEDGVVETGRTTGSVIWREGHAETEEHTSFTDRFAPAYDRQIQRWIDAATSGRTDGPTAWDGYRAAVATEAGVRALRTAGPVNLNTVERPELYRTA